MRGFSVAEVQAGWLTTGDAAKMLERTARGMRWIADQSGVPCARTYSGLRLYREADVRRLVDERARARLRGVKVLRPHKRHPDGQPRQLALFGPTHVVELPQGEVHRAESGAVCGGSDNSSFR